ncbi:hypothetical protein J4217_01700 [Candidatus Pacearchaeota archaeon]|nr:hypothetical protein [Candidatus Pacearchaeota archaeon]
MAINYCAFRENTGCVREGGSEYSVRLQDLDVTITVPFLWKHYMLDHLVQPNQKEREIIMKADPSRANRQLPKIQLLSSATTKVLHITTNLLGYSHQIGLQPDIQFINKLESILRPFIPLEERSRTL